MKRSEIANCMVISEVCSQGLQYERNFGVDLLKLIAAFLVVLYHFFCWGFYQRGPWLNEVVFHIANCCVNLFALTSGYVGIYSTFKLSRIVKVWLSALVIGCVTGVFCLSYVGRLPTNREIMTMLTPFTHREYWYVTDYLILCCLMPAVNSVLRKINKRAALALIGSLCFLFSIAPMVTRGGIVDGCLGMSLVWLLCLYVIGGCMSKLGKNLLRLDVVLIVIGFNLFVSVIFTGLSRSYEYSTSPLTIINSVLILFLFSQFSCSSQRLLKVFKPLIGTSLGVYLWHCSPLMVTYFWPTVFKKAINGWATYVLLNTLLVCIFLELVRLWLMRKCGVDDLVSLSDGLLKKFGFDDKCE